MMNPPSQLLELLGNASLRASLVVVLLFALRPWLRRAFGSGWVSLLWLVVLARLLVPWSAESAWSPFQHWPGSEATQVYQELPTVYEVVLHRMRYRCSEKSKTMVLGAQASPPAV